VICAIVRAGDIVIPRGDVRFERGDEVLALVDAEAARDLAAVFDEPPPPSAPEIQEERYEQGVR